MYKRLLCYINTEETRVEELEGLLDLASQLRARIIFLAVMEPEPAKPTEQQKKDRDQAEDRIWNFLYQVEDIAFGRELKVSLMLEEDEVEDAIASVAKSYEVDMCVTFPYPEINAERLLARLGGAKLLLMSQEG